MIDLKKLLNKTQIVANKKKITTLYWDKNICGFVEQRGNAPSIQPRTSQRNARQWHSNCGRGRLAKSCSKSGTDGRRERKATSKAVRRSCKATYTPKVQQR